MDEATIEKRLLLGEDAATEFKSVAHTGGRMDARDLAKAICALANSGGGAVFLGVEDDGRPTGVAGEADALMRQATQVCADVIHPAIWCRITKAIVHAATLLVIEVPAFSSDRPYRAGNVYYIRDANRSREATRDELVRLLQSADSHYDETVVEGSSASDLDETAVRSLLTLLHHGVPPRPERIAYVLRSLKCTSSTDTPSVAGLLMAGVDPQRFLPEARITCVRFPGTRMSGDFADRREIAGRLPDQLAAAFDFLKRHLQSPSHREGLKRVERGLPDGVLREALANAVAHRDYRAASQIRVFVFDDRVEIVNPGMLLNHLTLDSIRLGGISQRRNPIIASLLARTENRENLGLGVLDMIQLMSERGLPEPLFDVRGGHFYVTLSCEARASS